MSNNNDNSNNNIFNKKKQFQFSIVSDAQRVDLNNLQTIANQLKTYLESRGIKIGIAG